MNPTFDHIIRFNTSRKVIEICRRTEDGTEVLDTEISSEDATKHSYEKFAQLLGENIIIDSPIGRTLFP